MSGAMRVHRGLESLSADAFREPVASIGVFDGVHRGHRHLIDGLAAWAGEVGGETVVVTFEEHPLTVLGHIPPAALTSLDHRLILLERAGVDAAVVLQFTRELASWPPERFIEEVFRQRLGCRKLLMGFDSAFGKDAAGDAEYLTARPELGLEVRSARPFLIGDAPVSSTEVRKAILKGELDRARELLGRPVSIYGEVIHGDGRGRSLGFPTANLNLFHSAAPPHGVYVAEARFAGDGGDTTERGALVNIGRRPTFLGKDDPLDYSRYYNEQLDKIEVYIHEFDDSIYGERVEVDLHRKLRDERRFENSEALVAQIHADVDALLEWMSARP